VERGGSEGAFGAADSPAGVSSALGAGVLVRMRGAEGGWVGGGRERGGGRRGRAGGVSGSLAGNLGANLGAVDTGGVEIVISAPCRCCHRRRRRLLRRRCGATVHGRRQPPTSRAARPATWACSARLVVLLTPRSSRPALWPAAGVSRAAGLHPPGCAGMITPHAVVASRYVHLTSPYFSLLQNVLGCPLVPLWHLRKLSCTGLVLTVIFRWLCWLLSILLAALCLWHCIRRRAHVGAQLVRMATTL